MDKQKKQPTLTVKINGEDTNKSIPVIDWKKSQLETASSVEKSIDNETFPVIIEQPIDEFKSAPHASSTKVKKAKKLPPVGTIIVSSVAAISIGLFIGYVMLKVVLYETHDKHTNVKANVAATTNAVPSSSFQLPDLKLSVLQSGIFSQEKTATNEATALNKKGVPAAVWMENGKGYVINAVTSNLNDAKNLSSKWKVNGVSFYAKDFAIKNSHSIAVTNDEKSFLTASKDAYASLTKITTNTMLSGTINQKELSTVSTNVNQFATSKLTNTSIDTLRQLLQETMKYVSNYEKNKNTGELLKAQQALLQYAAAYQTLK